MIESRSNKQIVSASKLKQSKHRRKEKKFLIEGKKLVSEALNNNINLIEIFVTEKFSNIFDNSTLVSESVLEKLSTSKSPEGVIAVAEIPELKEIDYTNYTKLLILENIQDPGNLGTIIRTADAAGFNLVICSSNCCDFYNEKTLRASMGSFFHINVVKVEDILASTKSLKDLNYEIIGTSLSGEVLKMNDIKVPNKYALVLGNEANGVTENMLELCSIKVKIPIFGKAESLNVSIAAGILMYAYVDQ